MQHDTSCIILAAGNRQHPEDTAADGSAGKGRISKNLADLHGHPIIWHSVHAAISAGINAGKIIVVVKPELQHEFEMAIDREVRIATQVSARGSADAIRCILDQELLTSCRYILLLMGDQPLIESTTIARLAHGHKGSGKLVTVSTFTGNRSHEAFRKCGVIQRTEQKSFAGIHRDVPKVMEPEELHAGPYVFNRSWLISCISQMPKTFEGEQHVYPAVQAAAAVDGIHVERLDAWEALGADTYSALRAMRENNREYLNL